MDRRRPSVLCVLLQFCGGDVPLGVEQRVTGVLAAGYAEVAQGEAQLAVEQSHVSLLGHQLRL